MVVTYHYCLVYAMFVQYMAPTVPQTVIQFIDYCCVGKSGPIYYIDHLRYEHNGGSWSSNNPLSTTDKKIIYTYHRHTR